MSKVAYYVLLSRQGKSRPWGVGFGSWDREEVLFERQSYRDEGYAASDLKIIAIPPVAPDQATIDAAVAKLNAKTFVAPEDRGMTTEEFEAHHGRTPEMDDILASWRRLPSSKKR